MIIKKYNWNYHRTTDHDRYIAKNLMVAFKDTKNFDETDRNIILKEIRYLNGYSLPKVCIDMIKSYIIRPGYKLKNPYLTHMYLDIKDNINNRKLYNEISMNDPKSVSATVKNEVQSHGFIWEKEILMKVYGATLDELKTIPYNSKVDLPYHLNHIDNCDIYVKTTGKPNTVCMADTIRLFDAVNSNKHIHLVVITYKQDTLNTKVISNIIEVDLTNSTELLFGTLSRNQILELDTMVKSIPQKRKPTKEEHTQIYNIRERLQGLCGAIYLNIKCNSTQSRLQCSFNNFIKFINDNSTRVIARSNNNEFRGGSITGSIVSQMRKFNRSKNLH